MDLIDEVAARYSERAQRTRDEADRMYSELTAAIAKGAGDSPYMQAWLTGSDTLPSRLDSVRYPYAQHPTVYTAVTAKATSFGQLEAEAWPKGADRKKDKPIAGHWFPELLAAPGNSLLGNDLKQAIVTFLELSGEAFLWHQDLRRGGLNDVRRPNAIAMLPPQSMWPNRDADGAISSWRWHGPRGQKTVSLEEISVPKYFNPYEPDRGLGKLRAAYVDYTSDYKAAVWNRMFFENNAMPAILFSSPDKPWQQEDRRKFIAEWNEKYSGVMNVSKAATLPQYVQAEAFKLTQQDMDFLLGRKFNREQILSIFGVPPAIAGVFDSPNYVSSPQEQKKFFWYFTMTPLVRYLEAVFTEFVQRYEPDVVVFMKLESVLADIGAADYKDKVSTGKMLFDMGFKPTAINDVLGLGMPTAGQPWLDTGWLPYSVTPAEAAMASDDAADEEPTDEPPSDDGEEKDVEDEEPHQGPPEAKLGQVLEALEQKDDARAKRWSGLAAKYGDIGRSYHRKLRSWLWELRGIVLNKVRARAARAAVTREAAEDLLWSDKDATVKLRTISKRAWMQSMKRGADVLEKETGIAIDFDFLDPRVVSFLAEKEVRITKVSTRVREHVRVTLQEGIAAGETVDELAARVRDVFDVERSRSLAIARTETAQAFNGGMYHAKLQAGILTHEWLTSRDTKVRDSHEAMDGEVVAVGEPFSNGLRFAGDPQGDISEVANCRCSNPAVITSDEEAA